MNCLTWYRCGLIWLVCGLFLYDGGKFVRAEEIDATNENGEINNPDDQDAIESARYSPPEWFVADSNFSEQSRMLFVKTSEPHKSELDAKTALENESVQAVNQVLNKWMGIDNPESIEIRADYLLGNFVYDGHLEFRQDLECKKQAEALNREMEFYVGYVQLNLNKKFDSYIESRLQESRTRVRLIKTGLVGGSLLAMLTVIFGYLKLETATRGFYSRRLQSGFVVVAIMLVLLVYWFGQQLV